MLLAVHVMRHPYAVHLVGPVIVQFMPFMLLLRCYLIMVCTLAFMSLLISACLRKIAGNSVIKNRKYLILHHFLMEIRELKIKCKKWKTRLVFTNGNMFPNN